MEWTRLQDESCHFYMEGERWFKSESKEDGRASNTVNQKRELMSTKQPALYM